MDRRRRRRLERLRWSLLIAPPLIVIALYRFGLTLSPTLSARQTVELSQSPETLWGVLTDLDGMPTWRRDLGALERLPGDGRVVRWLEVRHGTKVAMERVEAVAPERMVIRVAGRGTDGPRWTYEIHRTPGGARLEITEERDIRNPMWRPVAYLMGGGSGRIDTLCRDLERRLSLSRPQIVDRRS
ncbi:MAG: SRPBCC family protein [Gemmatimonadota bacterium]